MALMGALVLVPTCLCPSPLALLQRDHSSPKRMRMVGALVTVLGSPPALVAILYYSFGAGVITLERLWVWTELLWSEDSALYIFLVVVYLPPLCPQVLFNVVVIQLFRRNTSSNL